jgi:hypothetical protein
VKSVRDKDQSSVRNVTQIPQIIKIRVIREIREKLKTIVREESHTNSTDYHRLYFCKTNFNMAEIKKEEAQYVDLPKIYAFKDARQKEVMLNRNFARVNREIDEMIKSLLNSQ